MKWIKKGRIFVPGGQYYWNKSHAQVPVVDQVNEAMWRIYYASRDVHNRSHTSYIEVEAGTPEQILYEHAEPILPLGKIGTFDDCGVMPSWIITVGACMYLFYIGWTVRKTIPYHNAIGLAISEDHGKTFRKYSEGPLFGLTCRDPYFTGTSCVLVEEGVWKNWYLSCTKWEILEGRPEPFYHIKYAESRDGIHWERTGEVAIDYADEEEGGIAKASVLKEGGLYKMWYSYRKASHYRTDIQRSYRIGYAESRDGRKWKRMDERAGMALSAQGWDAEMLAYPQVIQYRGLKYLFYNGNGFGKSGFGYAILEA